MAEQLKQALAVIDKEIEFIFDNEHSFLDKFGTDNYKCCEDAEGVWTDITKVSFSNESVYFGYVLDCGQHIGDSIKIQDYLVWKETQLLKNYVDDKIAGATFPASDIEVSTESPRISQLFKLIEEEAKRISEQSRKQTWIVRVPNIEGQIFEDNNQLKDENNEDT